MKKTRAVKQSIIFRCLCNNGTQHNNETDKNAFNIVMQNAVLLFLVPTCCCIHKEPRQVQLVANVTCTSGDKNAEGGLV